MYQLKIGSINLPEIYVSETEEEDKVAVENGFPFISWRGDKEKLIKVIMLPYLEKMFPGIKWMKVFHIKGGFVHQPVIKVPGDKNANTPAAGTGRFSQNALDGAASTPAWPRLNFHHFL